MSKDFFKGGTRACLSTGGGGDPGRREKSIM